MPMGGVELLAILAILLLLFGAKRVPQLARSLGVGARELKKAASEEQGAEADRSETKAASEEEGDDADRSETRAASEGADGSRTKKISEDSPYERDRA